MKHVIVGTAGHVDHGKSTLVQALTGTDPDRLQQEKTRGITIELGFAHATEGDIALSFVDVPGHERLVRNMLAGVGGMSLVMLHVAADESVMPQTREHFEICRLLRVPAGLVVLTKADLVDPDTLDVVRLDVEELVAGSFLEGAPVIPVSARTGAGLQDLRVTLATLAGRVVERTSGGPPRLPIDRVFTMRGFGTVVTGTLVAGQLCVDDKLTLLPSDRSVKVRGLQVHGATQERAVTGQRTAVNLAGVDVDEAARGETLTVPAEVSVTRRIDVIIELLPSAKPLRHGTRVRFHQGTRELLGRVAVSVGTDIQPGGSAPARLHFEAPAVLTRGDRFILRAYSPLSTIAGGTVLDPLPKRRGLRTAAGRERVRRLTSFEVGSRAAVAAMVDETGLEGFPVASLGGRAGVPWAARERLAEALDGSGDAVKLAGALVSRSHLDDAERQVLEALDRYHAAHPLDEGIAREELRERVFASAPPAVFEHVLGRLVRGGRVTARDRVALADRVPSLTSEERRVREGLIDAVGASGLTPPSPVALAGRIGASPSIVERVSELLVRQGDLVRAGTLLFHAGVLSQLKDQVRRMKTEGTDTLDVPAFKARYRVTRKHAIPLLEYLDREGVTRRVGTTRRIL